MAIAPEVEIIKSFKSTLSIKRNIFLNEKVSGISAMIAIIENKKYAIAKLANKKHIIERAII